MSIVHFTVHTLGSFRLPLLDAYQHHLQFSLNLCEELKKFPSSGLMYVVLAYSKTVFVCGYHSADRAHFAAVCLVLKYLVKVGSHVQCGRPRI